MQIELVVSQFRNKIKEISYMPFVIKDKKLFKKYKSIWNNIRTIYIKEDKKNNQWWAITEH